jgi:hypothetical protein
MIALIYIGIVCYLLIGLSIYKYIIEGGDKKHVGLLWLFGWGFYVIFAILVMLAIPFVELYQYIKKRK